METFTIANNNNEKLAAYLFQPSGDISHIMIISHGFRGAKENGGRICDFARQVNELGVGVLAFDFSGSGQSEGEFSCISLSRQASDLKCIINYVFSRFNLPTILLGRSFGGSTTLAGGSHDKRIAGYIMSSTPVFLEQTFSQIIPEEYGKLKQGQSANIKDDAGEYCLGPEMAADFERHDIKTYLNAIGDRPVLIIHASDDEIVDPKNAGYIKDNLTNATLYLVDNAGHRFINKTALRESITLEWIQKYFL